MIVMTPILIRDLRQAERKNVQGRDLQDVYQQEKLQIVILWRGADLNRQPMAYESTALPLSYLAI